MKPLHLQDHVKCPGPFRNIYRKKISFTTSFAIKAQVYLHRTSAQRLWFHSTLLARAEAVEMWWVMSWLQSVSSAMGRRGHLQAFSEGMFFMCSLEFCEEALRLSSLALPTLPRLQASFYQSCSETQGQLLLRATWPDSVYIC